MSPGGQASLLEKLMASVRPEFRVDVLVPDPDNPVLGVKRCTIDDCDRPVHERSLCTGHSLRWRGRGRPSLTDFRADPGPPLRGRIEPGSCTVSGCRFGTSGRGLCARHRDKWTRAGGPDPVVWAASVPAMDPAGRTECRLPFCGLWTENDKNVFCKSHTTRWRNLGFPDVEKFVADCERHGQWVIDLRGLPAALKLELQYALQCRNDEQSATAPPRVIRWTIRRAAESGVASLLELSDVEWRQLLARRRKPGDGGLRARTDSFLLFAREAVETLRDGSGWEVEYHRDVWRLWRLPGLKTSASRPRPRSHLRFDHIAQPWMRELSKRWVRWRLASGLSVATAVTDVQALTRFSEFLAVAAPGIDGLAGIDRPLL
jgi:hypothetical protein